MERIKKGIRYFYEVKALMANLKILDLIPDEDERTELLIKISELNYMCDSLKILTAERKIKREKTFDESADLYELENYDELVLILKTSDTEEERININKAFLEMII